MVPLLLGYELKMLAIAHFNFISESSLKKNNTKNFSVKWKASNKSNNYYATFYSTVILLPNSWKYFLKKASYHNQITQIKKPNFSSTFRSLNYYTPPHHGFSHVSGFLTFKAKFQTILLNGLFYYNWGNIFQNLHNCLAVTASKRMLFII